MYWIVIVTALALSAFLYYDASKRLPVIRGMPLAPAELISSLGLGNGPNAAASVADFSSDQWTAERLTVKPNASDLPDGTLTATRLSERFAAGLHRIETGVSDASAGEPHTLSLFVRPDGCAGIQFEMADHGSGSYGVARFDLIEKGLVAQIGDVTDSGPAALTRWLVSMLGGDALRDR